MLDAGSPANCVMNLSPLSIPITHQVARKKQCQLYDTGSWVNLHFSNIYIGLQNIVEYQYC